ncbi:nitroreductase family protein [Catenovulum sp. SM1970]|uniref:nitroreductase family protein n=1 Tax=Marinifaba aquimaris TaxID=2741323 RepID=UPI0015716806|nr:nitroreductase family protein [Marinifaba aquimaris]NTS78825.1 nitroreductase family protein [Marinifaba aquimaris]
MNIIEALNWRYAVKQFNSTKLTTEQINGLTESARLAPSSYGMQPYQLVVVENEQLKNACIEASFGQAKVAASSHLLVFANNTNFGQVDIDNYFDNLAKTQGAPAESLAAYKAQIEGDLLNKSAEEIAIWAQQQAYIALGMTLTYAAANKIDACPMTGFDSQAFNQILGLDALNLNAAIICPVGFRADDDKYASKTKYRKHIDELVVNI